MTTVATCPEEIEQLVDRLTGPRDNRTFRWPPLDRAVTVCRESGDVSALVQALGLLKGNYGPLTYSSHTFGEVPPLSMIQEVMAALR